LDRCGNAYDAAARAANHQTQIPEIEHAKTQKLKREREMGRAHEGRSAADCRSRIRSATKPGRLKIPTFCSATPGRRLPATVVPLPACPRTAALRLGLCPSLSRVSPFTFVLTRAHVPAFHSHFLTAHKTGTLFELRFLLSFSPGTVSRAKFPVPDDDGFKLFTSLCSLCLTQHFQLHPNPREIGKMILQHC
jgi:hypothetical protein